MTSYFVCMFVNQSVLRSFWSHSVIGKSVIICYVVIHNITHTVITQDSDSLDRLRVNESANLNKKRKLTFEERDLVVRG